MRLYQLALFISPLIAVATAAATNMAEMGSPSKRKEVWPVSFCT